MFFPEVARLKLLPWLVATAATGFLPFGLTPSAQAQTVIYNGRTIVTEDYDRYDDRYGDRYDDDYDRYDDYGRYDNGNRYGHYGRYDNHGRYDHRYDRYGRYDNYRYERYEHDADHGHDDYYDGYHHRDSSRRRPHITIIQERPSRGQSNPACLAFGNIRIACQR